MHCVYLRTESRNCDWFCELKPCVTPWRYFWQALVALVRAAWLGWLPPLPAAGGDSRTLPLASTVGSAMLTPFLRMHWVNCSRTCSWFALVVLVTALPPLPPTEATPFELDLEPPQPAASRATTASAAASAAVASVTGPARRRDGWNRFRMDMRVPSGRGYGHNHRQPRA